MYFFLFFFILIQKEAFLFTFFIEQGSILIHVLHSQEASDIGLVESLQTCLDDEIVKVVMLELVVCRSGFTGVSFVWCFFLTVPPPPPGSNPLAPPEQPPPPFGQPPMEPFAPAVQQADFVSPPRPNTGTEGRTIALRANHFQVRVPKGIIHHYEVNISPDKCPRRVNR